MSAMQAGAPDGRAEAGAARLPAEHLPVHDAVALTRGTGQARILLGGQVYTLRITRAGKLILTR